MVTTPTRSGYRTRLTGLLAPEAALVESIAASVCSQLSHTLLREVCYPECRMTNQFEAYRQELLRSDRDPKMVAGIVQWAKHQLEVRQIEAETNISNGASIRVLEKNGFMRVGPGLEPNTIRFLYWS